MSIYHGISPDTEPVILITGFAASEPTREKVRADLARAMGWTTRESILALREYGSRLTDAIRRVAAPTPSRPPKIRARWLLGWHRNQRLK